MEIIIVIGITQASQYIAHLRVFRALGKDRRIGAIQTSGRMMFHRAGSATENGPESH